MEEKSPVWAGFSSVLLQPRVWLVPIVWDLIKLGLATALAMFGMGWVRWDFNVGLPVGSMDARLVPPPALPSAEQLGTSFGALPPRNAGWDWFLATALPLIVMTVLDPLVRSGFLNQVNAALRGVKPDLRVFRRGVRRFCREQLILTLFWIPLAMIQPMLYQRNPTLTNLLMVVLLVMFYTAQYIIVTDDAWSFQALLGAPFLLWTSLSTVVLPAMLSLVLAALVSVSAQLLGSLGWVVTIPVWGIVGSTMAGAMMAGLQQDVSTRPEPGMPWACKTCKAQNTPSVDVCAVCGQNAREAG